MFTTRKAAQRLHPRSYFRAYHDKINTMYDANGYGTDIKKFETILEQMGQLKVDEITKHRPTYIDADEKEKLLAMYPLFQDKNIFDKSYQNRNRRYWHSVRFNPGEIGRLLTYVKLVDTHEFTKKGECI